MKLVFLQLILLAFAQSIFAQSAGKFSHGSKLPAKIPGMKLVWSEEFSKKGKPDPKNWTFEKGFVRNEELQWYQETNAKCKKGVLVIDGKRERKANPNYQKDSKVGKPTVNLRSILRQASIHKTCTHGCMVGSKSGRVSTQPWVRGLPSGHWVQPIPGLRMERSTLWNFIVSRVFQRFWQMWPGEPKNGMWQNGTLKGFHLQNSGHLIQSGARNSMSGEWTGHLNLLSFILMMNC